MRARTPAPGHVGAALLDERQHWTLVWLRLFARGRVFTIRRRAWLWEESFTRRNLGSELTASCGATVVSAVPWASDLVTSPKANDSNPQMAWGCNVCVLCMRGLMRIIVKWCRNLHMSSWAVLKLPFLQQLKLNPSA